MVGWFGSLRQPVAISIWTDVEIASALAMKYRMGALDRTGRLAIEAAWATLRADSFTILPVTEAHFARAAQLVNAGRGLRAGDALHLAIAIAERLELATLDRALGGAAGACGVVVHLPSA